MRNLFLLSLLILMAFSCATTTQYVAQAEAQTLDQNEAIIYLIRPSNFGSAAAMKIYQGKQLIGKLGPKNYISWKVNAHEGAVQIRSKGENKDVLSIQPEAGQTYYIKQEAKLGYVYKARTKLSIIDEEEAMHYLGEINKPS
ncbi:MAG: DUF2846 domain-containing protein [Bacteroidota bacterium]